jgi:hypothetical protein
MTLTIDEINLLLSGLAERNDKLREYKREIYPHNKDYYDKEIEKDLTLYLRLINQRERIHRGKLSNDEFIQKFGM